MIGYSSIQLVKYLEEQKLIKKLDGVYYLTDKLSLITNTVGSPKERLREFCQRIELPFQITTPNGQKYTVKYVTDNIGKMFVRVLAEVDEEELIRVTKKYYKETEYPVTIKNYFEQNVWESAIENSDAPDTSLNPFEE